MDHDPSPFSTVGEQNAADLRAVVEDVLIRRAAGEQVSDEVIIAAHPKLMPALEDELRRVRLIMAAREMAKQAALLPLREMAGVLDHDTDTRSHNHSDTDSGRLEVRCPNCHEPIEVAVDTALTDLTCSACGSHFSLIDQSKTTWIAPTLSKIGRFELVERLGVGSYGSVWKARDKELDRAVAIKIPLQANMTPDEQEKFFHEARAVAQLRHPNIVCVHEVGRETKSVYIVSDFVRGVTLGEWLSGQQLTSREAAELCAKIADAMHHAHENGVVHRDLKPANIMIDGNGEPHLLDFGLARRDVGEVTVTMDGHVLGTPAYMSPEQAEGNAHSADRRSDVYSLGVILFQLLTGELPFRGNPRMLMHQVIHDEPPSPRKLNSSIPMDLETITLKCLEKAQDRRYLTARELFNDLHRFLRREPIQARPITRVQRGWRWCQRHPVHVLLAASMLFSLMLGTMFATYVYASSSVFEAHREAYKARIGAYEAQRQNEKAQEAYEAQRQEIAKKQAEETESARSNRNWE